MSGRLPDAFSAALARLDRRLEREVARLRARYQLSLDEFRGLYISDEHVDRLVSASRQTDVLSADNERIAAGVAQTARWAHVASGFGLSPLDQDLLLIALAPELDLKYETVYAYLNDDVTRKWPTADLAARLVGGDGSAKADVMQAISPASTLRIERLLVTIDPPAARPSVLNSGFALHASVSRFLQGVALAPLDRPRDPGAREEIWSSLPFSAAQRDWVRGICRLIAGRSGNGPAVVIAGPAGAGRMRAARAMSATLELPLRVLDFRAVRRSGATAAATVADAALELRLEPALLCIRGLDALADNDGRWPAETRGLLAPLGRSGAPMLLLVEPQTAWPELLGSCRAHLVELTVPDYTDRLRLWNRALDDAGLALPDIDRSGLADRFAFTPGQIASAVATAADWVAMGRGDRVEAALVRDAARAQPRERLGSLAVVVRGTHGWSDLVLPPAVLTRLQEITAAIRLRHVVYGEWAFARRLSGGTGVKALFAGASGTGKTMAAGVIALELGLDLIKVDLSGVVSKYIGETEKHLDRVFAGARAGNALLFFDEADAIFGKRSEVKDAHDRYANIEVAYLLQKLEDHDGAVVLATNLRRNIDDAFSRRMHYVVDFPQPDTADRERLWRGMFPAEAPTADDIDFPFLARQFELPGGDIRNVVLDAAFLAASEAGVIGMRHLVRALGRHQAKQGRTPSMAEFQRYYELVG